MNNLIQQIQQNGLLKTLHQTDTETTQFIIIFTTINLIYLYITSQLPHPKPCPTCGKT